MSIRMGDKILAANYKPNNATQDVAGLARLATEEEITEGIATESVVTPYQLKETVNNRANIDLNNLSETGEARFNGKANVNLDNLSNVGETHFNNKYVQKSGDTMTGTLTINTNKSTLLEEVLSGYTSPSSQDTINTLLRCKSSNNKTLCLLEYHQEGETRGVELSVRNSKLYSATLALGIDETGNTYAAAPNPAENSDGNNIATTAWVNSKLTRYPIEISDKSLMPSWYVVYSDGWCEQGGIFDYGSNARSVEVSITFIKQFNSNDYGFRFMTNRETSGNYVGAVGTNFKTQNGIKVNFYGHDTSDFARYFMWEAKGYIS